MALWKGRIYGIIEDEFEIDADTEEEARELALNDWMFAEAQDLSIMTIEEVND